VKFTSREAFSRSIQGEVGSCCQRCTHVSGTDFLLSTRKRLKAETLFDEVNILGLLVITPYLTKEHPDGKSIKESSLFQLMNLVTSRSRLDQSAVPSRAQRLRYDLDALLRCDEIEGGRFILTRLLIWWSSHLLAVCCFGGEPWSEL